MNVSFPRKREPMLNRRRTLSMGSRLRGNDTLGDKKTARMRAVFLAYTTA
jgi:hypothetical protein